MTAATTLTRRWGRLSDRLAAVTQLAAESQQIFYEYENSVRSLLGRRDELRDLLGAYHARAAALGAAEDLALADRYRRARDWLSGRGARS